MNLVERQQQYSREEEAKGMEGLGGKHKAMGPGFVLLWSWQTEDLIGSNSEEQRTEGVRKGLVGKWRFIKERKNSRDSGSFKV